LKGGDMSDLKLWSWKDENIEAKDGAAYVKDPGGKNARITQKLTLPRRCPLDHPWHSLFWSR